MNKKVFIPYNTPSLKNSKIMGKFFSPTVKKYLKKFGIQTFSSGRKEVKPYKTIPMTYPVKELKDLFKGVTYPVIVGFHFVRGSRRKFDYINAQQLPLDMFTAFDIIPDDDMMHIIPSITPVNGEYYTYDKENPGVYIEIVDK